MWWIPECLSEICGKHIKVKLRNSIDTERELSGVIEIAESKFKLWLTVDTVESKLTGVIETTDFELTDVIGTAESKFRGVPDTD